MLELKCDIECKQAMTSESKEEMKWKENCTIEVTLGLRKGNTPVIVPVLRKMEDGSSCYCRSIQNDMESCFLAMLVKSNDKDQPFSVMPKNENEKEEKTEKKNARRY